MALQKRTNDISSQLKLQTLQRMGNKQPKSYKAPSFDPQNWSPLPHKSSHFTLYRNTLTNQQVEQYQIRFHNHAEYQKYVEFFEWRQREDHIVCTKFINVQQTEQFCNISREAKVYIEHLPLRLSDIRRIPFPENLYLIFSCLDGFEKLFLFVGYFQPNENLVCLDEKGKAKVWVNADLSKCHAADSYFSDQAANFYNSEQEQHRMVAEVIEMIENKSEQSTFRQYLKRNGKRRLSFRQGKMELIDYAKANHTELPQYLHSVLNVLQRRGDAEVYAGLLRQQNGSLRQRSAQRSNIPPKVVRHSNANNQTRVNANLQTRANANSLTRVQPEQHPIIPVRNNSQVSKFNRSSLQPIIRPTSQRSPTTFARNASIRPQSQVFQLTQPITQSVIHPQVKFNYRGTGFPPQSSQRPNLTQNMLNTTFSTVMHNVSAQPSKIHLPTNKAALAQKPNSKTTPISSTNNLREAVLTNKLLYSDTTQTYELDQQIAKDIIKYFG